VDFSRPLIGLMANEAVGKVCREIVGDTCQIVALFEENAYADCFVPMLTPFEWAKCFSFFKVLFTNRFHGTLLAMKNGVSPLTFDYASGKTDLLAEGKTKIRDLYERLGLMENHYFIGKKSYTPQETEQIRHAYLQHLGNDESAVLAQRLQQEAQTAEQFFAAAKVIGEQNRNE